jgi:hypothetical protein
VGLYYSGGIDWVWNSEIITEGWRNMDEIEGY